MTGGSEPESRCRILTETIRQAAGRTSTTANVLNLTSYYEQYECHDIAKMQIVQLQIHQQSFVVSRPISPVCCSTRDVRSNRRESEEDAARYVKIIHSF